MGIRTFNLILQGLGAVGLNGLDQLIGYMIVADLQAFCKEYHRKIGSDSIKLLTQFRTKLSGGAPSDSGTGSLSFLPPSALKLYSVYIQEFSSKKYFKTLGMILSAVGQKQLLRRQMNAALNFQAKIDSKMLTVALEAMNDSLLFDVQCHYRKPTERAYPEVEEGATVLGDLAEHLNFVGICNPMAKIYITSDPLPCLPIMLFLFIVSQISRLSWNPAFNSLCYITTNQQFDGTPLIVGILTILKQFHPTNTTQLIALLCQFVRTHIHDRGEKLGPDGNSSSSNRKNAERLKLPKEAANTLHFLDLMCKYGAHVDRKDVAAHLPQYMFDSYDSAT